MYRLFKYGFLLLILLPFNSWGQQSSNLKYYSLEWDNDVFMTTDYYYSQGMQFVLYAQWFNNNPVNLFLFKPQHYNRIVYGISVRQAVYTPKDIRSEEIQFNDRPYAGVLVLSSQVSSSDGSEKWLINSALDFGIMGPASGAGLVQYYYHQLTNNPLPNGWEFQQYNWPVVNYNLSVLRSLNADGAMEVYGKGEIRAGTLFDDFSLGLKFRAGNMTNYIKSLGMSFPSTNGQDWQFYYEVEPSVTFVAYNATLQGGWFDKPKVYFLPYSKITPIVVNAKMGIGLMYKHFGLSFDVYFKSKEFMNGTHHFYHTTRLSVTF